MRKYTEEELKGKFVVAYDTLCDGNQCMMEGEKGDENYGPTLFDSADEAFAEIFDGNCSILESHMRDDMLDEYNKGVTPKMIGEMKMINLLGDVTRMRKFMDKYPECDDSGEWVEPALEFTMNRKTFFTGTGIEITGKKLTE